MCNFAKANVSESPEEPIGGGKTRRVSEREREKKRGKKTITTKLHLHFCENQLKGVWHSGTQCQVEGWAAPAPTEDSHHLPSRAFPPPTATFRPVWSISRGSKQSKKITSTKSSGRSLLSTAHFWYHLLYRPARGQVGGNRAALKVGMAGVWAWIHLSSASAPSAAGRRIIALLSIRTLRQTALRFYIWNVPRWIFSPLAQNNRRVLSRCANWYANVCYRCHPENDQAVKTATAQLCLFILLDLKKIYIIKITGNLECGGTR